MQDASQSDVEPAAALLTKAQFIAVGSYTALAKHYPGVNEIDPTDWDFFAISATVALALELAPDEPLLVQAIQQQVETWDPNGLEAVIDCIQFVRRTAAAATDREESAQREQIEVALGIWLVRNATNGAPLAHSLLAPAAGKFIATALSRASPL